MRRAPLTTPADHRPTTRRDLVVDVVLAALVLGVVTAAITADVADSAGPQPAAYAFGAGFAALVFARHRLPVVALLATAALLVLYYTQDYPAIGLAVPVSVVLYSAAEHGRLWWAVGTAAVLQLLSTGFRIAEGDDLAYLFGFEFAGTGGLMAAVIALGDSVRSRRGWRAELVKQANAAELERRRETARRIEQERLRIARDLHDLLGHTVSVIALHTDVAREALRDDPDTAERSLAAARTAASEVVGELRATLQALRGRDGDEGPVPGLNRLPELVETVRNAGIEVEVRVEGEASALPAVADATAYRVVQEAFSNVLRHSGARHVTVSVRHRPSDVEIRVADDGVGADPSAEGRGWGVIGMSERLALLGGGLTVESPAGGGYTVTAVVPRREPE
ncbi:signal transduction histidine kinase [Stackebrandtia albiflava]|uniref:histidine kinase n=1 Tax=Stackebrandtia albiflava TaxID=406432 RepID=A0A562V278_9ACTN|nr:sensor histidine kinase [Stackebrandtia albiflava]TWJ11933.1 signal transduction histidine kinase [Stackebrandtia albiflava]